MKFVVIEDVEKDLKPGDWILYMDDIHKWEKRQLQVKEVTPTGITCDRHYVDPEDFVNILKVEREGVEK